MRQIPACHLRLFAEQVRNHGTVTLSRENAAALFCMAEDEMAFRALLKQIATSGGSNRDLVKMAVNALRERPLPSPANPRHQFSPATNGKDPAVPASYRVTWEIDIEAFSPIDAARIAKRYQTDRNTTANIFEVTDGAETVTVDLDELRKPPEQLHGDASRPVLLAVKGL